MSFEQPPSFDTGVENTPPGIEEILARSTAQAQEMHHDQGRLQRTLESIRPENEADQRTLDLLKERIDTLTAIREDVQAAAHNAALETAFRQLEEAKDSVEIGDIMQVFETYPELAESFLAHVLEQKHIKAPSAQLVKDVESALEDLRGADGKVMKGLAVRTTERVIRAVISAGTLGIGAVVYDCVKDAYVSIRARNVQRARLRDSLMSSTSGHAVLSST